MGNDVVSIIENRSEIDHTYSLSRGLHIELLVLPNQEGIGSGIGFWELKDCACSIICAHISLSFPQRLLFSHLFSKFFYVYIHNLYILLIL